MLNRRSLVGSRPPSEIDAPIPIDLTFDDGTLTLDGDARRRVVIELPAQVGGEAIEIDVLVRANAAQDLHVEVHLIPSGVGAAIAPAPLLMQALLAETRTGALDVTIDLP